MASTAIKQLEERALRSEKREKTRRATEKLSMEKGVGFGAAFVSSAIAGYIDGRFDLSDEVAGDGTRVFGIPIVPITGAVIAVGGMAMGGKAGSLMAYSGLGIGSGWAYQAAAKLGLETDQARRDAA